MLDIHTLEAELLRVLPDEETMPFQHFVGIDASPLAARKMGVVVNAMVSDALGNRQVSRRYEQVYNSGGFFLDPQFVEEVW